MATLNEGGFDVLILADATSWIQPYLQDLATRWRAAGHRCALLSDLAQVPVADFCFCLSFSKKIPAALRAGFKHTLVVHESDLPRGRGWSPMSWQILEGCQSIPITLFEAAEDIDAGKIYLQTWVPLTGAELHDEWRDLQGKATVDLCQQWLAGYPTVLETARDQTGEATYYKKRGPVDSALQVDKTIAEQFDLLRVVDNERYPAFFEHRGKRYIVKIYQQDD